MGRGDNSSDECIPQHFRNSLVRSIRGLIVSEFTECLVHEHNRYVYCVETSIMLVLTTQDLLCIHLDAYVITSMLTSLVVSTEQH